MLEYFYVTKGDFYYSLALGVFFAMVGMNINHDATHGALGPQKWYHHIFKFSPDWMGASRYLW